MAGGLGSSGGRRGRSVAPAPVPTAARGPPEGRRTRACTGAGRKPPRFAASPVDPALGARGRRDRGAMFAALRPLPGPASPPPHDVLPRRPTTPVVTQDPATVWPRIQDELRRAVPASSYEIWLAPLHPLALDGDELVLEVPTALHGWVAERFGRVLQTSVAAILGPSASVRLEPGDGGGRPGGSPGRGGRGAGRPGPPARAGRRAGPRSATSREARRDDGAWAGHD